MQGCFEAWLRDLESEEALQSEGEERGKMAGGLGAAHIGDRVIMERLKRPGCWCLSESDSPKTNS